MYSSGLKKLGKEFGLEAGQGRVYGLLEGFPVSLWDGVGAKNMLVFLGQPKGAEADAQIDIPSLIPRELEAYRIVRFELSKGLPLLMISFYDNPGTLKRMRQFFEEGMVALREAGLSQIYHCVQCGGTFEGAPDIALVNGMAMPVHNHCRAGLAQAMEEGKRARTEMQRQESAAALRDGSIFKGVLGAFLGALIGSIPWVLIYMFGYLASIGGILIGMGAVFGYKKLSGRVGTACVVSAVVFAALMVPLACYAGEAAILLKEFIAGNLEPLRMSDFGWLFRSITALAEWRESFRQNVLMGYLYAALGLIAFLISKRHGLRQSPGGQAKQ